MDNIAKTEFIWQYINQTRKTILNEVSRMPDEWEGLELKAYVARRFSIPKHWLTGTRKKEFKNSLLIENL
jgi:hypothetical protein